MEKLQSKQITLKLSIVVGLWSGLTWSREGDPATPFGTNLKFPPLQDIIAGHGLPMPSLTKRAMVCVVTLGSVTRPINLSALRRLLSMHLAK